MILRVSSESRFIRSVAKSSVTVVVIERRRIVRKIRLDDVQPAVAVIIRRVRAHACLFMSVAVERHARFRASFGKRTVVVVVK